MDSVQQNSSSSKTPENMKAFSKKPLKGSKKMPPQQNGEAIRDTKFLEKPPLKVEISQAAKVINEKKKSIQGMKPVTKLEQNQPLKNLL